MVTGCGAVLSCDVGSVATGFFSSGSKLQLKRDGQTQYTINSLTDIKDSSDSVAEFVSANTGSGKKIDITLERFPIGENKKPWTCVVVPSSGDPTEGDPRTPDFSNADCSVGGKYMYIISMMIAQSIALPTA